jgi:glycosyltransferase involved in cell wall biosynthesis
MIDLTMSLGNRTAVYDIGRELCGLASDRSIRYWRAVARNPIDFKGSHLRSTIGKILMRCAFKDLSFLSLSKWPRASKTLFIDPIFSLKTRLEPNDIVLCHDIAPVTNPEYFDAGVGETYDRAYRRIQASGLGIVFVSEFTKAAFLARYPGPYRFNTVIPLYHRSSLSATATPSGRKKPFILMVGGMEKRKNFCGAIAAFVQSRLAEEGYELIMAGPRGNLSANLLPIIDATKAVSHLGYVDDDLLAGLYSDADALFFPSFVEGFGVPALEAPMADTIPIVSAGTVLEEIVGPAGPLVDPASVNNMARVLRDVVAMRASDKDDRLKRIREHQRRFSIEHFRSSWTKLLNCERSSG